MGLLAQRLNAPKVKRCKYGQIIDRLDDDDRAALAEWEANYHATAKQRGVRHDFGPTTLAAHLLGVKIVVSEFTIRKHFDGVCPCTKETS